MYANLKFKLPEEREEFDHAVKAIDYHIIITDLDNYCRNKLKYEELSDEAIAIYEEIRNKLREDY